MVTKVYRLNKLHIFNRIIGTLKCGTPSNNVGIVSRGINFTVFSFVRAFNNKNVCAIIGCYVASSVQIYQHTFSVDVSLEMWSRYILYVLLLPMTGKKDLDRQHRWQHPKTFLQNRITPHTTLQVHVIFVFENKVYIFNCWHVKWMWHYLATNLSRVYVTSLSFERILSCSWNSHWAWLPLIKSVPHYANERTQLGASQAK